MFYLSFYKFLVTFHFIINNQKNEMLFYNNNNHILSNTNTIINQFKMTTVVLCQLTSSVKSDVQQSQIVMGWIVNPKCPRCKKLQSRCSCK